MSEDATQGQNDQALFLSLVMMLSSSAMQQLGKLVSPLTGKAEVDLGGAQISIDMLEMLQRKTRGNLAADEQRMMASSLASLQMNFVDVSQTLASAPAAPAPKPEDATPKDGGGTPPPDGAVPPSPAGDPPPNKKDAKYHKSYG
jgi:hypothetical protein